jgi:O-antigen ligase/polysaccharide polymerase Wzy-like membrane protein
LVFGVTRWRIGAIAALVLAVYEGVFRKWLFPEFNQWIYLAKDCLLLGAYVGFFAPRLIRGRRLFASHPAAGSLAAFSVLAALELANPSLPNLAVGLFGVKAYLIYVPLMYVIPAVVGDRPWSRKAWAWGLALAVIPLLVGIVQFWAPADSVLNRYAAEDELAPGVAVFGSMAKPRITGTFPYITGHTTYLTVMFLAGLSWLVSERRKRVRWGLYGVLMLVLANLLMTGSRGPLLILGAAVVGLLVLSAGLRGRQSRRVVATTCVALPLVGLLAAGLFPDARTAFLERAGQNEDLSDRLLGIFHNPAAALREASLFGYGIGSTHQARTLLSPGEASDALPPSAEGEWERIILEVGPLGFATMLLTRILVAGRLWKVFHTVRDAERRPYLATAFLFALVSIPGSIVFNNTAAIFYWLLAGFGLAAGPRAALEPLRPVAVEGIGGSRYVR